MAVTAATGSGNGRERVDRNGVATGTALLLVPVLEPILEEDAVEARVLSKVKDERYSRNPKPSSAWTSKKESMIDAAISPCSRGVSLRMPELSTIAASAVPEESKNCAFPGLAGCQLFTFRSIPSLPIVVGGTLIVVGGLLFTFWSAARAPN